MVVVVVTGGGGRGGDGRGVRREVLVEAVVSHGCSRAVGQRKGRSGTLLDRVLAVKVTAQRSDLVPQNSGKLQR